MVAKKLKLFSGLRFKNVVIESLAVFDTISSLQKKRATKTRHFAKMVKASSIHPESLISLVKLYHCRPKFSMRVRSFTWYNVVKSHSLKPTENKCKKINAIKYP